MASEEKEGDWSPGSSEDSDDTDVEDELPRTKPKSSPGSRAGSSRAASSVSRVVYCDWEDCFWTGTKQSHLLRHYRIHTNEYAGCGKAYFRKAHLNVHERSHTGDRPFRCEHEGCTHAFSNKIHLKRHVLIHEKEKPYKCAHVNCGEAFTKHSMLRKHEAVHTGLLPFACLVDGCGARFLVQSKLRRHEKFHARSYRCEDCGESYNKWSLLVRHRRDAHPSDRTCNICHKVFRTKDNLREHAQTHVEDRERFPCDECDKRYFSQTALDKHVRTVHSGERPFECLVDGCGKKFAHKQTLQKHVAKMHDPSKPPTPKAPRRKRSIASLISGIVPESKRAMKRRKLMEEQARADDDDDDDGSVSFGELDDDEESAEDNGDELDARDGGLSEGAGHVAGCTDPSDSHCRPPACLEDAGHVTAVSLGLMPEMTAASSVVG